MRDTGVWTYGVVNLIHILGIALLFGSIALLDLRLMGVWRAIPLAYITRPTVAVAATGLAIAATSGVGLLATIATDYVGNPFLAIKFIFIGLALVNLVLLHRSRAWRAHRVRALSTSEQRSLALHGTASLLFWLGAITCGRMIGYW